MANILRLVGVVWGCSIKDTNSIVLSVTAGSNYAVTYAGVGMSQRISDGGVLKRNGQMLEEGSFNLPAREPLPGRSVPTPYVLLVDQSRRPICLLTRIWNFRFSRARRISENIFGITTNHWREYRSPIFLHPEQVREPAIAVLAFHNWL